VCAVVAWGSCAAAQTYYKWTDDQGVVHFSDNLPPPNQKVEERHLAPPQAHALPSDANGAGAGGAQAPPAAQAAAAKTPQARSGPARVVLTKSRSPHTGPSTVHVSGQVKNVGGEDAQNVRVEITALDSGQGNPCLHARAAVSPATLKPDEDGTFDSEIDNPCLYGDPSIDVAPKWD